MKNMKTKESSIVTLAPASSTTLRVKQEIAALNRTYKKVSRSPETAHDFLYKAGLVTRSGKLRKKFRS